MNDTTYNGWTNYQTWVTKLWIDNDEGTQSYWIDRARELASDTDESDTIEDRKTSVASELADELEAQHDEFAPEVTGVYADLLGSASANINWGEIAASMVDDLDSEDWPMPEAA